MMTIRLFIPLLRGDTTVYWLDNQAVTILSSLIMIAFPITIETIISKFTRIVVAQTIDTFIEEVYILEHQLNMECSAIEKNRYLIDRVARENDVNIVLLETILRLEIFYRGRAYNRVLEKCACKYFSGIAIKKNISVGLAQIKISTAKEVLRDDPYNFIKKICEDKLNIEVCGRLLKKIINEYNDMLEGNSWGCDNYKDIYDYIACEYIGASVLQKDKIALIYSAVLRSFMENRKIYYGGSEQLGRCSVYVYKENALEIHYDEFQGLVQELSNEVVIQKKIFLNEEKLELEFICDNEYYVGIAKQFAKEHKCEFKIFEK
jgi:hypothetical protein